jgi:hypothetical protein
MSGASRVAALTGQYDLQAPFLDETALGITKLSSITNCVLGVRQEEWMDRVTDQSLKKKKKKKPPWLWSASELCRPSDRRFLAK